MTAKRKKNKWILASIIISSIMLIGSLGSAGYILFMNHNADKIIEKVKQDEETKKEDVKKIDSLTQEIAEIELDNSQLRLEANSRRGFI